MDALQQGTILQGKTYQYKIDKVLGQGTFGITYLAMMKTTVAGPLGAIDTEVKVAVKEFFMCDINGRKGVNVTCVGDGSIFEHYKRKFYREALNLSNLHHPNIIKVTEYFEANNTVYYVMEYIDGENLNDYIQRKGNLSQNEAIHIIKQVGMALASMHEKRMLHLDVKPSNIMMRENGEPILIDFGLSKKYDKDGRPEESTTVGAGTPGYAPLEQINYREGVGNTFPVTMDVYALGATLFKMLVGYVPQASTILNEGFPYHELLSRNVSDEFAACIAKAMALAKNDRFQTVNAFLAAIDVVKDEAVRNVEDEVEKQEEYEEEEDVEVFSVNEHVDNPYDGYAKGKGNDKLFHTESKAKSMKGEKVKKMALYLTVIALGMVLGAIVYFLLNNHPKAGNDPATTPTPQNVTDSKSVCPDNNHPHPIDLALPSGTRWACCNIEARKPEEYGGYFAWGETKMKKVYNDVSYEYYKGKVNDEGWSVNVDGFTDLGNSICGTEFDAASNWAKGGFIMPTKTQMEELINNCDYEWTTYDNVPGGRFTSKINGESIFLPAGGGKYNKEVDTNQKGFYWSGNSSSKKAAFYLNFDNLSTKVKSAKRAGGHLIRPVLAGKEAAPED